MTTRDFYAPGDWNAVCSMCGRKRKASSMVKNWQGLYRCKEHNEARQPQDFVRSVQESITPPWVQPPKDIEIYLCTLEGQSAVPDEAMPDCSIPGRYAPFQEFVPAIVCTVEGMSALPGMMIPGCSVPQYTPPVAGAADLLLANGEAFLLSNGSTLTLVTP